MDTLLFGLFACTLLGIAVLHKHSLAIAVSGAVLITLLSLGWNGLHLGHHVHEEAEILLNLAGLLLGFALLADHFERSELPKKLTTVLPAGRAGAFVLLILVALMSSVLDNIAAALIGGSAAATLFKGKVHIGYLAAIVAASNAGGAGSVVGDTTTTMIWLGGAHPAWVAEAAVGAAVSVCFMGWFASGQQHRLQPLEHGATDGPVHVDSSRLLVVLLILAGAIGANLAWGLPAVGVWAALILGSLWRQPDWSLIGGAAKGMVFLLSLVWSASLMPVKALPAPSEVTTFGLGIVSAFFDNIPLTKLAIDQSLKGAGHYDWGFLAFAVGYGGSMLWFGSSAGVALSGFFPQAKSAGAWVKSGWHVVVGYVLGFLAMLWLVGWHPHPIKEDAMREAQQGGPAVEQPK
jgi:Na+/H+ antiporter NhaD/arsenite permease-like protein